MAYYHNAKKNKKKNHLKRKKKSTAFPVARWITASTLPLVLLIVLLLIALALVAVTSAEPSSPSSSSSSTTSSSSSSSTTTTKSAFQPQIMRAWHCHGRNQRELVDRLSQAGIVSSPQSRDVMRLVDRQYYLPAEQHAQAYMDAPQSIGLGQTISAPHMHARAVEEILPFLQKGNAPLKILDVGCGSGYLTACFGRWFQNRPGESTESENILGKEGKVFGIDIYPHLVDLSKENMKRDDNDLLESGKVCLEVANGWNGLAGEAPFDAIHVGAAAENFPTTLAAQLKVGGILIVPVGPVGGIQNLYKIERIASSSDIGSPNKFIEKDYRVTELLGVRYVPLIERPN